MKEDEMSKLKPCPFCGGTDNFITVTSNPFSNDMYSTTHCKCCATGPFIAENYLIGEKAPSREHMEERATERWNTRPIEDDLRKRIAELEDQLEDWTNSCNILYGWAEDYKARIAELEAAQRWRVVADGELPEFGTSILFYDSILEKINKGTCTALDRDKTNLHWITDDGLFYHGNRCEYITRWMPLPEPPEVQDV